MRILACIILGRSVWNLVCSSEIAQTWFIIEIHELTMKYSTIFISRCCRKNAHNFFATYIHPHIALVKKYGYGNVLFLEPFIFHLCYFFFFSNCNQKRDTSCSSYINHFLYGVTNCKQEFLENQISPCRIKRTIYDFVVRRTRNS